MKITILVALVALASSPAFAQSTVVPDQIIEQQVEIQGLMDAPERVQGMVVNHTEAVVKDVVLFVAYNWRWNDERNPGEDTMSFGDRIEVEGDVPPGGSAGFAYMPSRMLADRQDGYYHIEVSVQSFKKVSKETVPATP